MKHTKYLLVGLTTLVCQIGITQDSIRKQPTKIGKASLEIGRVIKKEFIEIYKYEGGKGLFTEFYAIELGIVNLIDAATKLHFSAVRIGTDILYSKTAVIDYSEIQGFLKFIEMISEVVKEIPKNYTEYVYNLNELRVTAYQKKGNNKNTNPYWAYSMEIENKNYAVELKVLNEIKEAIEKNMNLMVQD